MSAMFDRGTPYGAEDANRPFELGTACLVEREAGEHPCVVTAMAALPSLRKTGPVILIVGLASAVLGAFVGGLGAWLEPARATRNGTRSRG